MSLNNAYFQCREHGSVYVLRDVTLYSKMSYTELEPLVEGIEVPEATDEMKCPICGGPWRVFFRD